MPRLFLLLALVGCGGGGGGSSGPSDTNTQFLVDHNARFNDGVTTRWPNLPVRVFANNIAQEAEVTEWASATGSLVTFSFAGSRSAADITFDFGDGVDICGETTVEFQPDGRIVSAEIRVVQAVFRGPQCVRTVTHEVGHALGFFDHTADGGLMDPDGGSGEITGPVAQFFRDLYSMPPGTSVGASQRRRAVLRRPGGRYVITIVDPVRR
ncbi:MAG: hypothetical protein ACRELA_19295 [Candidatus Rokuibacteriota bacterium]